jgi:FixJ family two-component response regulator
LQNNPRDRSSINNKGENNPMAKLTNAQWRDILARIANGETQASLAREYGISPSSVTLYKKRNGAK